MTEKQLTSVELTSEEKKAIKAMGLTMRGAVLAGLNKVARGDPLRQELREWRLATHTKTLANSRPKDKINWHKQLDQVTPSTQFYLRKIPRTTESYFYMLEKFSKLVNMSMTELDKLAQQVYTPITEKEVKLCRKKNLKSLQKTVSKSRKANTQAK